MIVRGIRRRFATASRKLREARMFARAMASPHHPVLAHLIPTRRCNLACTYCNEFDGVSPPVPLETLKARVNKLVELGTAIITLSGGEPLLHPQIEELIAHIRRRGVIATVITNGYLLNPRKIERLNRAGLDHLQISIDNLEPDEVSKKSLRVLDRRLRWLAEYAEFAVTVNTVLGSTFHSPEDALAVARRARQLGLSSTVGFLHDGNGQSLGVSERIRAVYGEILRLGAPLFSFTHYDRFQRNIAAGRPNHWHCRAGGRYLYVCEDGLVHWCSQQRGRPGIPLERYRRQDLEIQAAIPKSCAPFCTISCVHQVAMLDAVREAPRRTLDEMLRSRREIDPAFRPPWLLKALEWMFLESPNRRTFERLARIVFGLGARRSA
jgi:MoaA/NifB/PqqE/SkfB family radical SAM enzyme